jgi:Holliday junction resolvasome RuvABC endonuclease subunit
MIPVIGLDLSLTSTGFSGNSIRGTISSKEKGVQRLDDISKQIEKLLDENYPKNVVAIIEGYSFASRNSQSHAIGELGGVVRLTLFRLGIGFVDVPPTCRAKFATGKGNASKNEVISAVSARTGIVWSGKGADDEADAFVLEEMGLAAQGLSRYDWPKVNLEALEKVDWSILKESRESN